MKRMINLVSTAFLLVLSIGCSEDDEGVGGGFCQRLTECGELDTNLFRTSECEDEIRTLGESGLYNLEACEAELSSLASAESCEAFVAQDLCAACDRGTRLWITFPRCSE